MSDPVATLAEGGVAVVVLAKDFELPKPYDVHPQVIPLPHHEVPSNLPALSAKFPSNTKLVVIAGELSALTFGLVTKTAQRRTIPYVHRRNLPAVTDYLRNVVPERAAFTPPVEPEPRPEGDAAPAAAPAFRGTIKAFVKAEADLNKSSAEEARRLLHIAAARGIETTFGSLTQSMAVLKREGGRTGVPKSIMSGAARALATLDEAIAGLQLMREWVETTEKENAELRARVERFRKALE